MSNINRVVVSGNLAMDPELRVTSGGLNILGLRVAVNDRRKNSQSGQWEDYANFFDVTVIGNRAESLGRMLTKGSKVVVDGKLRWSQWEKDGQKRSKVEIVADDVELPPMPRRQEQPGTQVYDGYVPYDAYQEEIPF